MTDFKIPDRARRELGREIEWPPGSGRLATYAADELAVMAGFRERMTGEHTLGCSTAGTTYDLDCPRCSALNEATLIHEAKVELGATLSDTADEGRLPDPTVDTIGRMHSGPHATERDAAIRVYPRTGTQRWLVLAEIAQAGDRGMTDEEIGSTPGIADTAHRTRRNELVQQEWIRDSGKTRPTAASGSESIVWTLTDRGRWEWWKRAGRAPSDGRL